MVEKYPIETAIHKKLSHVDTDTKGALPRKSSLQISVSARPTL